MHRYPQQSNWHPRVNILNNQAHIFRKSKLLQNRPDLLFIKSGFIEFIQNTVTRFANNINCWQKYATTSEETFTLAIGLGLYKHNRSYQLRIHNNLEIVQRELLEDITGLIFQTYLDLIYKYKGIYTIRTKRLYSFTEYYRRMVFLTIGRYIYNSICAEFIIKESSYTLSIIEEQNPIHPATRITLASLFGIGRRAFDYLINRHPDFKNILTEYNYIKTNKRK